MIVNDFYPTQTTQYNIEYTDLVQNLAYTDPETMAEPYYMGYIPWEKVPDQQKASKVTVRKTDTEDYIKFEDVTVPENIPWFLTSRGTSDVTANGSSTYYVDDTTGKFAQAQYSSGYFGFLNSASMFRFNKDNRAVLYYLVTRITPGDTPTYATTAQSYTFDYDQTEFIDFLYNNVPITINLWTDSGVTTTLAVSADSFPDYGLSYSDGTYTYNIYPVTLEIPAASRDYSPSGVAWYSRVQTGVFMHANVDGVVKPYMTNHRSTAYGGRYLVVNRTSYDYSGSSIHPMYIYDTDIILGGFNGQIPGSFFRYGSAGQTALFGNMVGRIYNSTNAYVYRCLNAAEMKNLGGLLSTKIGTGAYGYTTAQYVQTYTDSNEAKFEFVSGLLEDIQDQLQPWQYENITANTFTADDIPEYVPPSPEPGGEEPDEGDWGDPVGISQTIMGDTAFSNFEVVRRAGLLEFVSELWAAPTDFWESLSVVGEVTANLSDYLISCRAYPVQLNVGNVHKDIYIGAGGKITLAADIYNAGTTNWISMGSITIPRQYGNFLDYNPYTSATISLPFAGTFEINPKYLYDSQIDLQLVVDITDGSGMWILENLTHYFPILIKQCRVAADIPVSGLNASQMASNILNATLTSGQHALSSINKIGGAAVQTGAAIASGGTIGTESALSMATMGAQVGIQALTDATNMAMGNKEIPFYTGGSGGAAAAEGNFEPYITLRRPLCTNPENYAHTVGNLVNKTALIGGLNGFTTCRNVDVSGIGQAVDKEKAQIKRILESGFYA